MYLLNGSDLRPSLTRACRRGLRRLCCGKIRMFKRELNYSIPRLHYHVNSRIFPDLFSDVCKNSTSFLWVFLEINFIPFAPVDFRRKPEPIQRTQSVILMLATNRAASLMCGTQCTPHACGPRMRAT